MITTIEVDTVFIAADLVAGHPKFEDWGLLIFQIGPDSIQTFRRRALGASAANNVLNGLECY